MKYRAPIFFALFLSLQFSIGQSNPYLSKVGVKDSLYSEVLSSSQDFWIQMPADYQKDNGVDYPVIYVLDGGVLLPQVASILNAESPGFMPEMIVVGISNKKNRTKNLTTSKVDLPYIPESGGADLYTEYILNELIPYVESRYPVTKYRTIIGHSYAGLFTLNMLLKHHEAFRNYIVIDPSLDWDKQKFFFELIDGLESLDLNKISLFLGVANEIPRFSDELNVETVLDDETDFSLNIRSNLEFAQVLENLSKEGFRFNWKFYENELHGTLPLINIFDGLKWTYDWYAIKSPSKFNNPDTPIRELIQMIEDRTKLLSEHFGYPVYGLPEELLDMLGHMNLEMGQTDKAFEFFNLAKKYFSESANAFNSMADFYIAEKKYELAIRELEKAYHLDPSEGIKAKLDQTKLLHKKMGASLNESARPHLLPKPIKILIELRSLSPLFLLLLLSYLT